MKYYRCGQILKTFGIKGELKIANLSDFDRFEKGKKVYILHNEEYILVTISKKRETNGYLYVAFENMEDINLVEKYHGDYIFISEEDREKLEDGKHYYDEIIGSNVYNQHKVYIGLVNDIIELPNGLLLEIKQSSGKISLVPYVKEFVKSVDSETKTIFIQEIEGLLW